MRTKDYCRALKARLDIASDYALAKALGVRKQAISNYVNGRRAFDNTMAVRVAELLELDPIKVIADVELERGSDPALWKQYAARAAAIGALALGLVALLQAGSDPVYISEMWAFVPALFTQPAADGNMHCQPTG